MKKPLEFIYSRSSVAARFLTKPAPEGDDLEAILKAGVCAPDHGGLQPWRFITVKGAARETLGKVFAEAARARRPNVSEFEIERERAKPMRSPLIIVVVAKIDEQHPKIPAHEQMLSAGAAAQNMQLASHALGYASIWLTGEPASDWHIKEALGLSVEDVIVGFLYMGTAKPGPAKKRPDIKDFVEDWTEPKQLDTDI